MAESVIFTLIFGSLIVTIVYYFNLTWFDPRFLVIILFLLILPGLYAAFTSGPFVPSARKRHRTMIKIAKLSSKDIVYDLGCGDGRLVFASAPLRVSASHRRTSRRSRMTASPRRYPSQVGQVPLLSSSVSCQPHPVFL